MTRVMFAICTLASLQKVASHGFLTGPRSRNLVAFEETVWWPQTENDPQPETCPHCLNRGGSLAECGIAQEQRNYDVPKNALGGPMPTNIQATYDQGQEVILNVTLTAHHKGHFEFAACPISSGERPTTECFAQNKLTFVEDLIYGSNYDPNYPHRAYIAPVNAALGDGVYVPNYGTTEGLMDFSFKMRLPDNVYGDLVLIQWYYLTANSCIHDGYAEYNWPEGWRDDTMSASECGDVSPDGDWGPEQFWNCAETKILASPNAPPSSSSGSNPTPPPTIQVQTASVAIPVSLPSLSSASTLASGTKLSSGASHGKTIIGYYASWQWYDRNKLAAPENMDFTKMQRVNYAFFQTDVNGNIWGTDSWGDPNVLFGPYNWNPSEGSKQYCSWDSATDRPCNYHDYEKGLIHQVHAAGAEIYPSLGGWTLSDPFPAMSADATARANFASKCVELIQAYDFDGIDIDWEYPGFEEHSGTPNDTENFRLLLDEVRSKLDELGQQTGRFYGLTAALPCGPSHIANMDIVHVASTLSELNLMTYDFHGAFSATTGVNAPLYFQGWGEEDFSLHDCVENWLAGGGTKDKINIGLPFYGRSFATATGLNEPHGGADQQVWGVDDGTPQYFNIMAQLPSMNHVWDKQTWTDWAYFEGGGAVSFDGVDAICAKTQYAIEHELNGFIIWELSGDVMDDLSTPLLDVVNSKLANPSYSCGEPGYYPGDTSPAVTYPSPSAASAEQPNGAAGLPVSLPTSYSSEEASPSSPVAGTPTSSAEVPSQTDEIQSAQPSTVGPSITVSYPSFVDSSTPGGSMSNPTSTPVLLHCNGSASSSTFDAKPMALSFSYELHRHPLSSSTDAIKDIKTSMLNDIAGHIGCTAAGSVGRRVSNLRNNPAKTTQDHIVAILSQPSDMQSNNSVCTIAANIDSVCDSMIGSLTVYIEKDTPSSVVKDVWEEMIYLIRTGMASGRYESSTVLKVIFVDDLTVDPESTVVASMSVSTPEPETGTSSSTIVILFGVLLVFAVGFAQFLFLKRAKRPVEESAQEEHVENSIASSVSHVEDVWKKALDTYDSKKSAVDPIGNFIVTLGSDSSDNGSDSFNGDEIEPSREVEYDDGGTVDPPDSSHKKGKNAKNDCNPTKNCDPMDDDISDIIASCLPMECDASALTEQTAREDPRPLTDFTSMKISELKKELDIYGVDHSNLIEKQEYIDAIKAARRRTSSTEPASA